MVIFDKNEINMKEEDKLDYNNPHLNYIWKLFSFMFPDEDRDTAGGWWEFTFPRRYNEGIKFPKSYKDYLDNINIQMSIKALGLNVDEFWYFILFIYDISGEKTKDVNYTQDSAKTQYENFINALNSAFETKAKDIVIELKINGKKQKAIINNDCGLQVLAELMYQTINDAEEGSPFDMETSKIFDTYNESLSVRNYLVITYFKKLFECLNADLKKGKTDIYNKNILITEILLFMRLIEEEQANEDYIKNTLKYYKGKEITLSSFSAYY